MTGGESHDFALQVAHGNRERMRAVRAGDRDEPAQALRMKRRECQTDHRAIRRADECVHAEDPELNEQCGDRIGLVFAADRAEFVIRGVRFKIRAFQPLDRENAKTPRVDRAIRSDECVPPALASVLRRSVAIGGDAALHDDDGCIARTVAARSARARRARLRRDAATGALGIRQALPARRRVRAQ